MNCSSSSTVEKRLSEVGSNVNFMLIVVVDVKVEWNESRCFCFCLLHKTNMTERRSIPKTETRHAKREVQEDAKIEQNVGINAPAGMGKRARIAKNLVLND